MQQSRGCKPFRRPRGQSSPSKQNTGNTSQEALPLCSRLSLVLNTWLCWRCTRLTSLWLLACICTCSCRWGSSCPRLLQYIQQLPLQDACASTTQATSVLSFCLSTNKACLFLVAAFNDYLCGVFFRKQSRMRRVCAMYIVKKSMIL